jgi:hypothetical protein
MNMNNKIHNAMITLRTCYFNDAPCDQTLEALRALKAALGDQAALFTEIFAIKLQYKHAWHALPAALRAMRQTQVRNMKAVHDTRPREKAMAAHA